MISTLRSIDSLLNEFDQLSKCHGNLLSNFDTNISDIKNPLKNITTIENEQRKSKENILLNIKENDKIYESSGSLEDFHRRTIKNRFHHRPPSYSSNDSSLIQHFSSRSISINVELTSLPKISLITVKENNSQPVIPISTKNIIQPKIDFIKKNKSKSVLHNSPSSRRNQRTRITAFTMQTINRLSKPNRDKRLPDQKPSIKCVQQQSKSYQNVKKEPSKSTRLPPMKRTKTTNIKPSSKKLKPNKKIPKQTIKTNSINDLSRPLVFLAPAPTIRLQFPTQPQQKSSRIKYFPKIFDTMKRPTINIKT